MSSKEKLKVIVDIVIKIVENNCNIFESRGGTQSNNIPRDRRILFRRKKKLRNTNSADTKVELENGIGEIDKKLLESHDEENILKETRAVEKIKSNPNHLYAYAREKLKTRSRIGPFKINGKKN